MKKSKPIIGIDPDTEKSGVAFLKESTLELNNLDFFELFEYLKDLKIEFQDLKVYIECGFLNGGNRHLKSLGSHALNSKIGERIGANHETAKKIIEMCEYLKITHIKVKPTRSKSTNDEFKKITGYTGQTNQEQRDAFFLIYGR
jgi:hypothetical protein